MRLKFQNHVIFRKVSFTCVFLLVYRGSQLLQFTTKLNPHPLIELNFVILLNVVNSDTDSIILRIFYYTPI